MRRVSPHTARVALAALGAAALLLGFRVLLADTMWVPTVELREQERGLYILDASMARRLVGTAVRPVLPAGCSAVSDPEITDRGATFRVVYELDCRARPLTAEDDILLPWNVDGIQLTALWLDGGEHRGLVGKEQAGVVIRLGLIMPRRDDPASLTARHLGAGLEHFLRSWAHVVLIVGLALFLPVRQLVPVLAGLTAGHAISLPLAELGLSGLLPVGPTEATVAAAIVVFMAVLGGGARGRSAGAPHAGRSIAAGAHLALAAALLGIIHGLGIASHLTGEGFSGGSLVVALFAFNVGVDAAGWAIGLGLSVALSPLRSALTEKRPILARVVGVAGAFLMFSLMAAALRPASRDVRAAGSFLETEIVTAARPGTGAAPSQLTETGRLVRPFLGYLIVEPYQVRLEVLMSVPALGEWIEIPDDGSGVIPTEAGQALAQAAANLLAARSAVRIDGASATPAVQQADFVTVGTTGVLTREQPVPEPVTTAILGATLLYETEGLVETVEVEWGLFGSGAPPVPVTLTDPAATLELEIRPDSPALEWRSTLGDLTLPAVEETAVTKPRVPVIPILLGLLALGLLAAVRRRPEPRRGVRATAVGLLLVAYLLYPFARVSAEIPLLAESRLSREDAADVLERLLTNVYRSFDIHSEEAIYDRLALTVTGDQLLEIYLESRQALELENRGGARVRIEEVVVREARSVRSTETGYAIDAVWTVGGSVNHFGHQHFRQNRYDAVIRIVPVDGVWKIEAVEVAEQKRLL